MQQLTFALGFALLVGCMNCAQAQLSLEWENLEYGGFQYYFDEEPQLLICSDGGIVVKAGEISLTTGRDIHLLKYNPDGALQWSFEWNGAANGNDRAYGVKEDANGALYLYGSTQTSGVDHDALLIKLSPEGAVVWTTTLTGTEDGEDRFRDIAIDDSGDVYATGWVGTNTQFYYGRVLLARIMSTGQVDWQQLYAQEHYAGLVTGRAVKVVNGNCRLVYAHLSNGNNEYRTTLISPAGQTLSEGGSHCALGSAASSYALDVTGTAIMGGWGQCRYAVYKSSPSGGVLWSYQEPTNMPPNSSGDECLRIVTDESGYIYTTGRHYGDDFNGPTYTVCDILTLKISPTGTVEWSHRYENYGAATCEIGNDVYVTNDGWIFVGGLSGIDPDYDGVVLVLNQSGELVDSITFDGGYQRNDCVWSVAGNGAELYLAGISIDDLGLANIVTRKYSIHTSVPESSAIMQDVHITPNPMSENAIVRLDGTTTKDARLLLVDQLGRTVASVNVNGRTSLPIERGQLEAGAYSVCLASPAGPTRCTALVISQPWQ